MLFQNRRYKYELTSKTSKQFVFVDTIFCIMLLQYYKLVLFFFNYKEKNTHKIKDPHKVDNELWPLVCCMNRGNAQ